MVPNNGAGAGCCGASGARAWPYRVVGSNVLSGASGTSRTWPWTPPGLQLRQNRCFGHTPPVARRIDASGRLSPQVER